MGKAKKDLGGVAQGLYRDGLEKDVRSRASRLKIGYSDLRKANIPSDVLSFVSREEVIEHKCIPLRSASRKLYLGVVDPEQNIDILLDGLKKDYRFKDIVKVLISEPTYLEWLSKYNNIVKMPPLSQEDDHIDLSGVKNITFEQLDNQLRDAPIQDLLKMVLLVGFNSNASDVHIEPKSDSARIRYRLDGVLHQVAVVSREKYEYLLSQIELNSSLKLNVDYPQNGRFSILLNKEELSVRIETMPSMHGDDIVLRLFNTQSAMLKIHDLGLLEYVQPKLDNALLRPHGMILVVGPTGAGKTSTIYAILNELNSEDIKIITLEDPVEYELQGVTQSQINEGESFADRLKAVLREDPNIIMVGEIRDANTAQTALQAALTGHLLVSTLHANDAATAITRLSDMIDDPAIVTASTNVVIAQRLVRKICPDCKKEYQPNSFESQELEKIISTLPENIRPAEPYKFFQGSGCQNCNHLGYRGRIGIFELLEMSSPLEKAIGGNASIFELQKIAIENGMITMEQDGLLKALKGITTITEVLKTVRE